MKRFLLLVILLCGCPKNSPSEATTPVQTGERSTSLFQSVEAWLEKENLSTWKVERVLKTETSIEVIVVGAENTPGSEAKLLEVDPKTYDVRTVNKIPADYGWSAY